MFSWRLRNDMSIRVTYVRTVKQMYWRWRDEKIFVSIYSSYVHSVLYRVCVQEVMQIPILKLSVCFIRTACYGQIINPPRIPFQHQNLGDHFCNFISTSHSDEPAVPKSHRSQGLNFSLLFYFFILYTAIYVTFHVYNQVQHYESLPMKVWKCGLLLPYLNGRVSPLSVTASFWLLWTGINTFYFQRGQTTQYKPFIFWQNSALRP